LLLHGLTVGVHGFSVRTVATRMTVAGFGVDACTVAQCCSFNAGPAKAVIRQPTIHIAKVFTDDQ
jgi:hypothetical protein